MPDHLQSSGLRWLWLTALTLVLDQASKWLVIGRFNEHEALPLTSYFSLVRWHNPGAAFSFLADQPGWQQTFFSLLALVASAVILAILAKTRGKPLFSLALALILGGAVGNLIDRVSYGYVVDFLLFHWRDWFYPAFNVADSAITVGAVMLIWDSLRKPKEITP